MKVLYLVTGIRPPLASGSQFIQNLIFTISNKGVNATIISPIYIHTEKNMSLWAAQQEKKYNIKFVLIDTPAFIKKNFLLHIMITPLLTTVVVIKLLSKEKFDIVHEFTSTPAIILRSLIYKFFKTPSIFTLAVLNKTILGKLFWFKIFDFGSAYLIPSREITNSILDLGVKKQKVFYLPPGINIASFKPKTTKLKAREKLDLPKNMLIMTYFGPLTEEKGVLDILKASNLFSQENQKKIFIGLFCYYLKDFRNYKNIAQKISSEAPKNLKLYEKYVDISLLLTASDYIIYPLRSGHGTTIPPISILEALAAHKPVITTDILGIREIITNKNGILIPPGDPPALAKAIQGAHLRKFNQNKTFEDFDLNFDLNNVCDKLLSIYKQICFSFN